jgi:hypothetical protein
VAFHVGKFKVSLFIILPLGASKQGLKEKIDMAIRITNTYYRYESINHFYLNRGKAYDIDNNDNDNETR